MPDFSPLKPLLLNATREAFATIQAQHPDEQFYGFGLFHAPLWEYISPTCNTEAGLARTAEKYRLNYPQYYGQQTIEETKLDLRWCPPDWFHHLAGHKFFEPVNAWIWAQEADFIELRQAEWEVWEQKVDIPMMVLCREVLRALDADGLFGDADARQHVVLNIMMGDQDNAWLEHARVLNPPEVYARWVSEIL